jgi:hypothetical protein
MWQTIVLAVFQKQCLLWRLQVWAKWPVMSSGGNRPATEFTNYTASLGATTKAETTSCTKLKEPNISTT